MTIGHDESGKAVRILNCARCGESAFCQVTTLPPDYVRAGFFVRLNRFSKCKKYKPKNYASTCRSDLYTTQSEAIAEWNATNERGRGVKA